MSEARNDASEQPVKETHAQSEPKRLPKTAIDAIAEGENALNSSTPLQDFVKATEEQSRKTDQGDVSALVNNWEYDDEGNLVEKIRSSVERSETVRKLLTTEGPVEDPDIAHVVADTINKRLPNQKAEKTRLEGKLAEIKSVPVTETNAPILARMKAQLQERIDGAIDLGTGSNEVHYAVRDSFAEDEKKVVEQLIDDRIQADMLPWTMPNSEISPEIMDWVKGLHDGLKAEDVEPSPDDVFRIPPPMKRFEGSSRYAPQDAQLLATAGIEDKYMHFTREELKSANVFFVNRVGAGEQPIFGMPIPDPESEGGVFKVQDRTFLTKEEFEKVYQYQQEHGYGIGDRDPEDVQMDMLMYTVRPEGRAQGIRKGSGHGSRENKYGRDGDITRSPFVDSGFIVRNSIETNLLSSTDEGSRLLRENGSRINTTTLQLINGHPEYPGLSEMFDPNTADHDQRYMTPGAFVKSFYEPPPSKKEVLKSMQYKSPTGREYRWVGAWPEDKYKF